MSKMSEISLEIQELLVDGVRPSVIATELNVPIVWVYSVMKELIRETLSQGQDYDPYNTVNS